MAEIANPQVVRFSNDKVRVISDILYSAYYRAKSIVNDYNAGNIGSLINDAGAGELIADGSDIDGRTRLSGGDIYNMITALNAFIAFVEGGDVLAANRTDVITKPHVNSL